MVGGRDVMQYDQHVKFWMWWTRFCEVSDYLDEMYRGDRHPEWLPMDNWGLVMS